MSQKHSYFSRWWAHSRPKHVENDKCTKNKYTKVSSALSWLYLYDYAEMHGSENMKFYKINKVTRVLLFTDSVCRSICSCIPDSHHVVLIYSREDSLKVMSKCRNMQEYLQYRLCCYYIVHLFSWIINYTKCTVHKSTYGVCVYVIVAYQWARHWTIYWASLIPSTSRHNI